MYYPAAQAYAAYVEALASMTVPLKPEKGYGAYVPVKLYNSKTDKVAGTIQMLVDTGAEESIIGGQYAKALGIDNIAKGQGYISCGVSGCHSSYNHKIKIQIGTLKPVEVPFSIATVKTGDALLGWRGLLNKVKLEIFGGIQKPQLTYSELAVAAMGNAAAYFRSRF